MKSFRLYLTMGLLVLIFTSPAAGQFRFFLPTRERNTNEGQSATVEFTATQYQSDEGAGTASLTLRRTGDLSATSDVQVSITGGTAIAPGDYTGTSFPLTVQFAISDAEETVSIPIVDDSSVEGVETITLSVSTISNATIGSKATTTLQIICNDTPPDVAFSQSGSYQAGESDGITNVVTLSRTGDTTNASEVSVSIAGGTASGASDYQSSGFPMAVTFASGETTKTVPVDIVDDGDVESTETITFSVSSTTNANIIAPSTATLEIIDDDTLISGGLVHNQRTATEIAGNVLTNPTVNGTSDFAFGAGGASYDPTVTRTADGSGSIKIEGTNPGADFFVTGTYDLFGTSGAGYYCYSFFVRSDTIPNLFGAQCRVWDNSGANQHNDFGLNRGAAVVVDEWEEIVKVFYINGGTGADAAARVAINVFARELPLGSGTLWVDDLSLFKLEDQDVVTFINPPAAKQEFNGSRVKIDSLGNWQVHNGTSFEDFFLRGMHTNGLRADFGDYSTNGWNCSIWESVSGNANGGIERAANGNLWSMFKLADYVQHPDDDGNALYGDMTTLNSRLSQVITDDNLQHVIGYYLDNEINYNEWNVFGQTVSTVRALDTGAPFYTLASNAMRQPSHAVQGWDNAQGAYTFGLSTEYESFELQALNGVHTNPVPAAIAQISTEDAHPGALRQVIYRNIMNGARGIVYYADGVAGTPLMESSPWFTDMPNIANEIDNTLLPLIRQPHWVEGWDATSSTTNVTVAPRAWGTRKFVWLVNDTTTAQSVTVTLSGSHGYGNGDDVVDYFTGTKLTDISSNSFTFTIAGLAASAGTRVLEIVDDGGTPSISYTFQGEFNETEADPIATPYTATVGSMNITNAVAQPIELTGGNMFVDEPTSGWGWGNQGAVTVGSVSRQYGQILACKVNFIQVDSSLLGFGLTSGLTQNSNAGIRIETSGVFYNVAGTIFEIDDTPLSTSTDYEFLIAYDDQTRDRCAILIKTGTGAHEMKGVFRTSSNTTTWGQISNFDGDFNVDWFRIPQVSSVSYFPSPVWSHSFDTTDSTTLVNTDAGGSGSSGGSGLTLTESVGDWEHASNRLESVGAVTSIVTTDVSQSDLTAEFTIQAASGGVHGFVYRYVDSNNYWVSGIDIADGDYKIVEVTSGTATTRATITSSLAALTDATVQVIVDGTTHRLIAADQIVEYTSSQHQSATTIGFKSNGVDGVQIENAAVWPLTHNDVPVLE